MPRVIKSHWMLAAILAVLIVAGMAVAGAVAYAQSAGDIPLLGKLEKGFVDPSRGVIDAWHIDYDAGATLPPGARSSGTVWAELNTIQAGAGTSMTVGIVLPTASLVLGDLHLFNHSTTLTASNVYDYDGSTAVTEVQRGDIFEYIPPGWRKQTGLDAAIVTKAQLDTDNTAADGEVLSYDGGRDFLEWRPLPTPAPAPTPVPPTALSLHTDRTMTGDGSTSSPLGLADDAVDSSKIHDGTVGEADLDVHTPPVNGYVLEYSSSNGMQWTSVATVSLGDNSVTTAKIQDGTILEADLSISGTWQTGYILAQSSAGGGFEWVADNTGTSIADNSIGEGKLAIANVPTNGYVLEWDQAAGEMRWATAGSTTVADNAITTPKIKDANVTEPKLAIDGTQQNGWVITWDGATSGGDMEWAQIIAESVAGQAITEPKLKIANDPSDGFVLVWDNSNTIMRWVAAGAANIADGSIGADQLADGGVTEPKLGVSNDPTAGYVIVWNGSASPATMTWATVGTDTIANNAITGAKIGDGEVGTDDLTNDAVTAAKLADAAVVTGSIHDDAVTAAKLADAAVVTGSIHDEGVTEPKLDVDNDPSAYDALRWFSSTGMTWATVIDLFTTLPAVADVAEGSFVGKTETTGDALSALYYKGESDADEIQIRMDDITDRNRFAIGRAIGYNSGSIQPSIYGKGGAIFPTDPPGLTLLIELEVGGGDWHMEMEWGSPDTPSFGTADDSVIYLDYRLPGAAAGARQKMTLKTGGWTSHPQGGGYATQKFTPHSTYTFSFWDAATGGARYTIPDVVEDHLAKLVDERHLQDSDGKIIDRINDVYALTAHGSYRGDFDKTRAEGYGKGDIVTAKGSETGSAQTDANTVIYIARSDIAKGTGELTQPHEDDGNWLEISNGFEDVLLNEAVTAPSAIGEKTWTEKNLDRAITADDNERDIVLEFEHVTSTQINAPSVFTHTVMGPVDRWLSLTPKATSVQNFQETMCATMPGPFGTDFTAALDMNVVCIARNSGAYEMLIYVHTGLPSVRTYITLK